MTLKRKSGGPSTRHVRFRSIDLDPGSLQLICDLLSFEDDKILQMKIHTDEWETASSLEDLLELSDRYGVDKLSNVYITSAALSVSVMVRPSGTLIFFDSNNPQATETKDALLKVLKPLERSLPSMFRPGYLWPVVAFLVILSVGFSKLLNLPILEESTDATKLATLLGLLAMMTIASAAAGWLTRNALKHPVSLTKRPDRRHSVWRVIVDGGSVIAAVLTVLAYIKA